MIDMWLVMLVLVGLLVWSLILAGGYITKSITENVALETGVKFGGWSDQKNLGFDLRIQHGGDHRGVFLSVDLLFMFFEFNVYDKRHEEHFDVED